jgi:hypothetical protein
MMEREPKLTVTKKGNGLTIELPNFLEKNIIVDDDKD